jgi:hypothetical protein
MIAKLLWVAAASAILSAALPGYAQVNFLSSSGVDNALNASGADASAPATNNMGPIVGKNPDGNLASSGGVYNTSDAPPATSGSFNVGTGAIGFNNLSLGELLEIYQSADLPDTSGSAATDIKREH